MKKISIICFLLFVVGLAAPSAFAQICNDDDACDDGLFCTGEELCNLDTFTCGEGIAPCSENQVCDEDTDTCVYIERIAVDIKPGSCPSPLNVRSQGVLPVAIYGSDSIDVTTIDPASIFLTREGGEEMVPVAPIRLSYDDAGTPSEGEPCACDGTDDGLDDDLNNDGITDLTLKFKVQDLVAGLALDEVESKTIIPLVMLGETENGSLIMGEDCVKIINPFKWWNDLVEKLKKTKKPKHGDDE